MINKTAQISEQVSFFYLGLLVIISSCFAFFLFFPAIYALAIASANHSNYTSKYFVYFIVLSPFLFYFGHFYHLLKSKLGIIFWSLSSLNYFVLIFALILNQIKNPDSFHPEQIVLFGYFVFAFFVSIYYLWFSSKLRIL